MPKKYVRKKDGKTMEFIQVPVSSEEKHRLRVLAAQLGIEIGELARRALSGMKSG